MGELFASANRGARACALARATRFLSRAFGALVLQTAQRLPSVGDDAPHQSFSGGSAGGKGGGVAGGGTDGGGADGGGSRGPGGGSPGGGARGGGGDGARSGRGRCMVEK